jgi:uncharacterized membrane protein
MDVEQHSARNWHEAHQDTMTPGQRVADGMARAIGSWPFIIAQSVIVVAWVILNLTAYMKKWDPYPFILLNLMFSVQAAYAGPVIMMSQNRQAERDRVQAQADFETNVKAEHEIEDMQRHLESIEASLGRIESKVAR